MSEPLRKTIVESNDPRLNIMIGSTTIDLPEHRAKVQDAIISMGHHPVAMEFASAEWKSDAITFSLAKVDQSEVYLGIFGERYGYIPEDPVRNPEGLSVTELEYRHAVKRGIPTLLFLSHKEQVFKPAEIDFDSDKRAKLERLKSAFQASEICGFFRSPDDLAVLVVRALHHLIPKLNASTIQGTRPSLPRPPEVYAVPSYTLTHKFIGRLSEMWRLDAWGKSTDTIMVVESIGGIGKSALTWEWMQESAPTSIQDLAGRIWWSFYERGTSMQTFVRHALAYVTCQDPESLRKGMSHHERGQLLLTELRRRPYLLVLDGFERVLTAYHRLDKAQVPDDQVDTGLTKCINPTDGALLVQLLRCRPSKILLSSRLFPHELVDRGSRRPVAGVRHLHLDGLPPQHALDLIHDAGVHGDRHAMLGFIDQFGRHSLLLRIVCGMIADYPKKPYDFDAWYADPNYGGGLKLSEVDLKQRNTHILHYALCGLGDMQRQILSRIAVLPENADYDTIAVVNPLLPSRPKLVKEPSDPFDSDYWRSVCESEKTASTEGDRRQITEFIREIRSSLEASHRKAQEAYRHYQDAVNAYRADYLRALIPFDKALKELVDRGLVQWDRAANSYDMHPVVRGYAAEQLDGRDKAQTFDQIRDHFASLPPDRLNEATEIAHVKNSLEIYRAFVGAGRLDEAANYYRGGLSNTLLLSLGAHAVILELLKPLFRNDFEAVPSLDSEYDRSYFLNHLAIVLGVIGRDEEALSVYRRKIKLDLRRESWVSLATGLRNYSTSLFTLGRGAEAAAALSLAYDISSVVNDADGVALVISYKMIKSIKEGSLGEDEAAFEAWRLRQQSANGRLWPGEIEYWRCFNRFQHGRLAEAEWRAGFDLAVRSRDLLHHCMFLSLHAMWALREGRPESALDSIEQALQITRRTGAPSLEYHDLRAWALARLWRPDEARAALEDGVRSLYAAETYLVLGDRAAARECLLRTYHWAWGEGPPHVYWYQLERCRALLVEIGEPEPQLPAFDPATVPTPPFEHEIRARIAQFGKPPLRWRAKFKFREFWEGESDIR